MTIDFASLIDSEQKRTILSQRIAHLAAEAWQHDLNRRTCLAVNDAAGAENHLQAINVLAAAIEIHQSELDLLGDH